MNSRMTCYRAISPFWPSLPVSINYIFMVQCYACSIFNNLRVPYLGMDPLCNLLHLLGGHSLFCKQYQQWPSCSDHQSMTYSFPECHFHNGHCSFPKTSRNSRLKFENGFSCLKSGWFKFMIFLASTDFRIALFTFGNIPAWSTALCFKYLMIVLVFTVLFPLPWASTTSHGAHSPWIPLCPSFKNYLLYTLFLNIFNV